jgi:hypothetical protein
VIIRKSISRLDVMQQAGAIVAEAHALLAEHVRPGVTTAELDRLVDEFIRSRGGVPTFLGYPGPYPYPASICASLNDVVVHGIPNGEPLSEGDVLSVDVGVTYEGFVGDSAYTYKVGEVDGEAERLLETCEAALWPGSRRHARARTVRRPHATRRPPRTPASRSSARSSATVSDATCTRTRRSPTRRPRPRPVLAQDDARDRADDHCRRPEVVVRDDR